MSPQLFNAASAGDTQRVRQLIASKADLEWKDVRRRPKRASPLRMLIEIALRSVWLRSDGCTLWEAGCGVRLRLSVGIVPRGARPSRTPAWRHAALAASRVQRALPVADRVV